jgi:hypothetical protein
LKPDYPGPPRDKLRSNFVSRKFKTCSDTR